MDSVNNPVNNSGARVVVGLDFGTTYSGYSFAHKSKPKDIFTFYDWVGAPTPYCKTLTGIYYKPREEEAGGGGDDRKLVCKSWGYPGRAEFERDCAALRRSRNNNNSQAVELPVVIGTYLTRFKLDLQSGGAAAAAGNGDDAAAKEHLLPSSSSSSSSSSSGTLYPSGLTVNRVISDYLREIGKHVMEQLHKHYGEQLSMESVQWCITVPSIWSDSAKRQMKKCMVDAGLVMGANGGGSAAGLHHASCGSPHRLIMVLEPEAASCHCHHTCEQHLELQRGDKLLVADIGGGTSDIVVQEWLGGHDDDADSYKVQEVTRSTGGFCGGIYVDKQFIKFMTQQIGCLTGYFLRNPSYKAELLRKWEELKRTFGDPLSFGGDIMLDLPRKLSSAWEDYDQQQGLAERESYEEFQLSHADMQAIFDPVVNENLDLIGAQIAQTGDIKVMLVVGGFAGSPYLMKRIKERFACAVEKIISPPNPGNAVCQGAVALALNPGGIVSRIARKTFGIETCRTSEPGDPPDYCTQVGNVKKCENRFSIYVQKGSRVAVNHCVTKTHIGLYPKQKTMRLVLFSSDDISPRYTKGGSAVKEGELVIDISNVKGEMEAKPEVSVSMYFGRSSIEMRAVAVNFGNKSKVHEMLLPITFGGVLE